MSQAIISSAAGAVSQSCAPQRRGLPALQTQQKARPTRGCCLSWVSFDISTSRNTQNSNILHHKVWLLGNCSAVKCTPSLSARWRLIPMKQVARNRPCACGGWEEFWWHLEECYLMLRRFSLVLHDCLLVEQSSAPNAVQSNFPLECFFPKGSHWWVIFHYY